MFDHRREDRELDDELRAYVDLLTAEKISAGLSPAAARRAALLETGGVEQVKEEVRDVRPGILVEAIAQDARYALRTLRKAPGYTAAAVVTLAMGIGAATAIFSMVNGVLLHRLPIGSGDRLVHLSQPSKRTTNEGFSVMEVADLNRDLHTVTGVAEYHSMSFQLYGHGDPLRVTTGVVSDRFFDMIGVKPVLGRTFLPGEEAVGAPPVVLLSHAFWMSQFNGDSSIVGATFTMNDKLHTVVGVLPPLPGYPSNNDIWMPAGACPFRSAPSMMNTRDMRMVNAFAVVKPGMSLERVRTELAAVGSRYHRAYPAAYPDAQALQFAATGARDEMTARAKPILYMLLATAAFLLLIAVANVATLSLSRQLRRSREFALRVALGAGGARLYRQLAFESLLLTFAAGVAGVGIAAGGVGLLRTLATKFTPRAGEIVMSAQIVIFAVALCLAIAFVIAAAPFVHALRGRNVANALRQGNTGSLGTRGDIRMRNALVTAQVALAFVMLVGAGLVARSLVELERVDAGVDVHDVLTAQLTLNFTKYNSGAKVTAVTSALLQRLDGFPGVTSFALASSSPLRTGGVNDVPFQIEGIPIPPGTRLPHGDATSISPDYFKTVGIPLLRGRAFSLADHDPDSPPVIINERMVKEYWGGRDPIGARVTPDSGKHWMTVVGIAGNVRTSLTDADVTDELYVPILSASSGDVRVFMRTTGAMPPVEKALRAAVRDVDPQQPVSLVQTLEQVRGAQLAEPRLTTTLVSAFAVLALILTATGLSGVIAYGVTQRLPEIGIRIALGATRGRVLALVMREGLVIVAFGLAVGWGVSIAARGLVSSLLFHVGATDPATYVMVAAVILGTAAVACFIPSRRALRADPARVFRGG
ncbi:MAG: ADOP family duplicated permease [Gemmatimonadales bacterium]